MEGALRSSLFFYFTKQALKLILLHFFFLFLHKQLFFFVVCFKPNSKNWNMNFKLSGFSTDNTARYSSWLGLAEDTCTVAIQNIFKLQKYLWDQILKNAMFSDFQFRKLLFLTIIVVVLKFKAQQIDGWTLNSWLVMSHVSSCLYSIIGEELQINTNLLRCSAF